MGTGGRGDIPVVVSPPWTTKCLHPLYREERDLIQKRHIEKNDLLLVFQNDSIQYDETT
jgi:hypothetical protein